VAITFDKKATVDAIRAGVRDVAKVARSLVRHASGGGRKYGKHQASAAGEPPSMVSGELAGSIRTSVKARDFTIIGRILDAAEDAEGRPYPRFQEVGAAGGGGRKGMGSKRSHAKRKFTERKMSASSKRVQEPRPFLTTALDSQHAAIEQAIAKAVQADIKLVIHAD
jgi:hypothetical protein